ncbi:ThuA domain-containing protein [Sphingobium lactosutens]|uniref:ThuA domain-containing protein n=1 Tax=Sphingobium lactosutens TaxID=522773 RepID=UPI001C4DBE70|nr:ThuA domain-containing protein [Sphingobium lactosutens]
MRNRISAYLIAGGRFHDIDFARLELLKLLAEDSRIQTKVGGDYREIDEICASDFLITYTCDVLPDPQQVAGLASFLERGGRWFALHGTNSVLRVIGDLEGCSCPREAAPEFFDLLGSQFKSHPPIGQYRVDVTDIVRPMTAGIASFETIDEQYLMQHSNTLEVLLETRFSGQTPGFPDNADWSQQQVHPVLYSKKYGRGEIMYLTLGHCRGHYDLQPYLDYVPVPERCSWNLPVYYDLLRRGIRWSMSELA